VEKNVLQNWACNTPKQANINVVECREREIATRIKSKRAKLKKLFYVCLLLQQQQFISNTIIACLNCIIFAKWSHNYNSYVHYQKRLRLLTHTLTHTLQSHCVTYTYLRNIHYCHNKPLSQYFYSSLFLRF
jgi:hypothetical protein